MSEDRLQKILARAGFGSRRHVEEMIEEGRVTVNGRVVTVGDKADLEHDAVKVDGKRVHPRSGGHRYLLLNKPRAVMSTVADPEGRPTVLDLVPLGLRKALVPVGRLDFLTEGLILLTDDGDLAQRVAHPRYGCTKTYEVKVRGLPDERSLEKLRRGIVLEGQRTRPASIDPRPSRADSDNTWWTVELGQGRTRQIREMFQRIGHPVMKLRRIAIGPVRDPDLPLGELRELSEREVEMLRRAGKHRARAEAAKAKAAREGTGKGRPKKPRKAGRGAKGGKAGRAGKPTGKAAGRAGEPAAGKKGGKAGGAKRPPSGRRASGSGSVRPRSGAAGSPREEGASRRPGAEGEPVSGGRRRRTTAVRRGAVDDGGSAGATTGGDRRSNRSPEGAHGRRGRTGGGASAGGSGRSGGGGRGAGGGATGGAPSWFFGVAKPGKGSRTTARGSAPRDEPESGRTPPGGRRSEAGEGSPGRRPPGKPGAGKPRGGKPGAGRPRTGKPTGKPGAGGPKGGKPQGGERGGGKPADGGRSGPSRRGGSGGRGGGRR